MSDSIRLGLQEKQATSIFVAHKLKSVADADQIFVLDNGRVVEQGSHPDLITKSGGLYRNMWEFQEAKQEERVEQVLKKH